MTIILFEASPKRARRSECRTVGLSSIAQSSYIDTARSQSQAIYAGPFSDLLLFTTESKSPLQGLQPGAVPAQRVLSQQQGSPLVSLEKHAQRMQPRAVQQRVCQALAAFRFE